MSQAINFSRASNPYQISEALISITKLRLRTYIGFNPEEKTKQQDVVINAEISYRADTAAVSDDETDAFNYKDITKQMISLVEHGRFGLLEKLTSDLLAAVTESEQVSYAKIMVDKPTTLLFADSVSVTLSASRR